MHQPKGERKKLQNYSKTLQQQLDVKKAKVTDLKKKIDAGGY
ncbi:MAG: hypothetical protein ACXWW0_07935 [Bacteroidia bacterium]